MKMQTKILDALSLRIVPLKVPKGPLSRFSAMFATMVLAMFLTTPPSLRNSASPLRKILHFLLLYNLFISLYVVSIRIQNASHFSFHIFWEILQRMKVKLFIYTISKYTIEK